jgi:hypothetical protein
MLRKNFNRFSGALCAFSLLFSLQAGAQQTFFQSESESNVKTEGTRVIIPNKYHLFKIAHSSINNYLLNAPHEKQVSAKNSGYILELPMPDGEMMQFSIVESPIFEPELAEKYPEIKTYLGQGIMDRTASVRLDISPAGFHAMIRSRKGTIFIDPYFQRGTQYSISYFKRDFQKIQGTPSFSCAFENEEHAPGQMPAPAPMIIDNEESVQSAQLAVPSGDELRKYRLAIATTGEYTTFHGGTVPLALAAMTTTVNRVNEVYENDLAVRLLLIADTDDLIETDAATDPYTNGNTGVMINEAQTEITAEIGSANFDIGHLFGTDSGGLAGLGVVCNNAQKARGVTGSANPTGDPFDIDYVCHEVGHQFGANHTQNNTCNRTATAAYEPGSASTIMGYAGICAPNLQGNSDPIFHSHSYDQIQAHIDGTTCADVEATTNNAPVANAGIGGYTIPISTPFELTGSANDVDGDDLTYTWEQHDLGPSTDDLNDMQNPTGNQPIFRVWEPTDDPTRVFPRLVDLVNNSSYLGEMLPTYTRDLNFRFVVRDNHAGSGGFDYDELSLTASDLAGPFLVTALNGGESVAENQTITVEWDVANTDQAPVNCSEVSVFLSVDGGFTYPYTLTTGENNDGSTDVTIPLGIVPNGGPNVTTCRIKVKADNNVFFDISDANFTITEPNVPDFALTPEETDIAICAPGFGVQDLEVEQILNYDETVLLTVDGVPAGASFSFEDTLITPGGNTEITFEPNTIAPGDYTLTITGTDSATNTLTHTVDITYHVANALPAVPTLTFPADGATGVTLGVNMTWTQVNFIQNYIIEIATDEDFTNIIQTSSPEDANYSPSPILLIETEYFWRVRGLNACGFGTWSDTLSFTTTNIPEVYGCTDPDAFNYDPDANVDDGSCVPVVMGCTNPDANNFNANANTDDGSCIVDGCTNPTAVNYNPDATNDDGSCIIFGCTDSDAFNYNPDATNDDGSCIPVIMGCIDEDALNYNPNANTDNGSCLVQVLGCTDPDAYNYDPDANIYDGSCIYLPSGCTDTAYNNYDPTAAIDDGSCSNDIVFLHYAQVVDNTYNFWITAAPGVTISTVTWTFGDNSSTEYGNPQQQHTFSTNGSYHVEAYVTTNIPNAIYYADTVLNLSVWGCTDVYAINFDWNASIDDGSCIDAIYGCMDSTANNYNALANANDGSCTYTIAGCTDEDAFNYNPDATIDDGSCVPVVLGCTDTTASNYNPDANTDDGSCTPEVDGCTDPDAFNYNPDATNDDGSCIPVVLGCTDEDAINYNADANTDDGSCDYPPTTDPIWDVEATSENHTILVPSTVTMDISGGSLANGDYIGVFFDKDGTLQCGGYILWDGTSATITAYGAEINEDNGFQNGESFIWKVWDVSELTTLDAEVTYDATMPNEGEYADDGISAITGITASEGQSIDMEEGWNFVSTNIDPNDPDISVSMAPIADDLFLAKDEDGNVYWPQFNINNIGDLTIGKAYKVKMDAEATWHVSGSAVNPANHDLELPAGWSYLGYLRKAEAAISSALDDINGNIWLVKDATGNVYWPQFNINNIGNMEPGQGYQINMQTMDTLTYDDNTVVLPVAKFAAPKTNKYYHKAVLTNSNMVLALPSNILEGIASDGDEIAAFNEKGILIGSTVFNGENTALTIWGDDSSTDIDENIQIDEQYSLKLWSAEKEIEYLIEFDIQSGDKTYNSDKVSILTAAKISPISETWSASVYPNPTSDKLNIQIINQDVQEITISMYNHLGIKVMDVEKSEMEKGTHNLELGVKQLTNGMYFVLIQNESGQIQKEAITVIH